MLKPTEIQEEELKNRFSRAWAKFNIHKQDLVNDKIPIHPRLKLFDATVTPTFLYCSEAWALTQEMRDSIKSQQRKMLRCIAKCHRTFPNGSYTTEEYVDWVKKATSKVNLLMGRYGAQDWVYTQRGRKWEWANKIANMLDSRWTFEVIKWNPPEVKIRGRPKTRWSDDINKYLTEITGRRYVDDDWVKLARDKESWVLLKDGFALQPRKS